MATTIELWTDIAQIIASIGVVGALSFTYLSFIRLRKSEQIQLTSKFYNDLNLLLRDTAEFYRHYRDKPNEPELKMLYTRTFGVLDWYAYLIRSREIKDKDLIKSSKATILDWYNGLSDSASLLEEFKKKGFTDLFAILDDFKA